MRLFRIRQFGMRLFRLRLFDLSSAPVVEDEVHGGPKLLGTGAVLRNRARHRRLLAAAILMLDD